MIDRLYEIAKIENDINEDIYSKFIDKFPEKMDIENFKLLILNFEDSDNSLRYKGMSNIGIKSDNKYTLAKQLWKIRTKGRDSGPCTNYNSKKPSSFIDKIIAFVSKKGINEERLFSCLEDNKDKIIDDVRKMSVKTTWVSLKLNNQFLSENQEINVKIEQYINKKKGLEKSEGMFKNGTCYLCHSEKVDLVDIFKIPDMAFGTLDKKENISMNLKDESEYKMCSVCLECQKLFNEDFTNTLLKKEGYTINFYGLKMIILPSIILDKTLLDKIKVNIKRYNRDYKTIRDEIEAINKLRKDLKSFNVGSLANKELEKKKKVEQNLNDENLGNKYLNSSNFGIISDYIGDSLLFSAVLYETSSSQFIIYDVVEDISKSRITKIAEIHKEIANNVSNNYNLDLILFYKMLLKYQFDKESKKINDYIRGDFICFVKYLLSSFQISHKRLTTLFMNYIHQEFYNKEENKRDSFLSFEIKKFKALLEFLSKLNCLEE